MNVIYASMNSPDSRVDLPVELDMANKGCALFEVTGAVFPYTDEPLFLCVDYVDESFVGQRMMPILRRIQLKRVDSGGTINHTFNKMLWVSCSRMRVKEFRLYISNADGNCPPFAKCHLNCTLVNIPNLK